MYWLKSCVAVMIVAAPDFRLICLPKSRKSAPVLIAAPTSSGSVGRSALRRTSWL